MLDHNGTPHDYIHRIEQVLKQYPSRPSLAAAILSGQHVYSNSHKYPFSRSLLWKTSLLQIDISLSSTTNLPSINLINLRNHRNIYNDLICKIGIPWHLLPTDSIYYSSITSDSSNSSNLNQNPIDDVEEDLTNLNISNLNTKRRLPKQSISNNDDPLSKTNLNSNSNSNSNSKSESDINILSMIIGDVERLFPEYPDMFIESKNDKIKMIKILYRYSKWINEQRLEQGLKQIGYVQGMHELCAVIYAVVKVELYDDTKDDDTNKDNKTNTINNLNMQIKEFLASKYFQHDVFAMFTQLMSPIIDKYFTSSGIVRESIFFDLKLHHIDHEQSSKYPGLATSLKNANIESQLWLTRWFRMLLTRELGLAYSVRIWDGLIAYACVGAMSDTVSNGHDISVLLPYVIILLILRIRSKLLQCLNKNISKICHDVGINGNSNGEMDLFDESEALSLLLHYPIDSNTTLSRSVSPEFDDDNNIDNNLEDNKDEPLVFRKSREKQSPFKRKLEKMLEIDKLPSSIDLFSDAALICGLSDSELNQFGPSLIEKYSKGDIYSLIKIIEKNNSSNNLFFNDILKSTKSWKFMSPSSSTTSSTASPKPSSQVKIDSNRSRLENRLQQRVHDRLKESTNK